jgi:hypothetical protein
MSIQVYIIIKIACIIFVHSTYIKYVKYRKVFFIRETLTRQASSRIHHVLLKAVSYFKGIRFLKNSEQILSVFYL